MNLFLPLTLLFLPHHDDAKFKNIKNNSNWNRMKMASHMEVACSFFFLRNCEMHANKLKSPITSDVYQLTVEMCLIKYAHT